jgi:hypothetical protein
MATSQAHEAVEMAVFFNREWFNGERRRWVGRDTTARHKLNNLLGGWWLVLGEA